MKIKKTISINLDVELGSDFQMESFETAMTAAVQAVASFYNSSHKQNKINVSITGTDARWKKPEA